MDEDDFEELISFLTPREENAAIKSYQNTTALACPACEEPFDDLVVCKEDLTSLNLDASMDLCASTTPEGTPMLFTHRE